MRPGRVRSGGLSGDPRAGPRTYSPRAIDTYRSPLRPGQAAILSLWAVAAGDGLLAYALTFRIRRIGEGQPEVGMYPDLSGADRFVAVAVVVAVVLHVVAAVAALRWARRCAGNLPGLTTDGPAPAVRWSRPPALLAALWRVGIPGVRPPGVVPAAGVALPVAALGWCLAVPASIAIGRHAPDPSEAADFVLLVGALLDAIAALLLANVIARISTRQDARARKLAGGG